MTHWATPLIGKPWRYGAQGPDEFDCWGFVRYVQRVQYSIALPDVLVPDTWPAVRDLLENHGEHRNWNKVDTPQDGDIVMMARNRIPVHVGIALRANGAQGVLHCFEPSGVVFQPLPSLRIGGWGGLTYYRRAPCTP
jgi:cell wall-associated NlpC family hydrolase